MIRASKIVAVFDWLVSACAAAVGLLILLSVALVTADVVGRYFLSQPIGWVFELTEHILVCVPFLGMAWLVRQARGASHVRIEIVVNLLPVRWRPRADAFAYALCALTCGFTTFYAIETTVDHFSRGIVTYGIYPIPKFILIAIVAFGLALTTIEFARKSRDALRTGREQT